MTGKTGSKRGEPQVFTHNIVFKKMVEGEEDGWAAHVAEVTQDRLALTEREFGQGGFNRSGFNSPKLASYLQF